MGDESLTIGGLGPRLAYGMAWGFWLGIAGVFLGILVGVAVPPLAAVALAICLGSGIALAIWQARRVTLVLAPRHVVVTNPFKSVTIPLADVDSIVPSRSPFPAGQACAGIRRTDGVVVPSVATCSWGWSFGDGASRNANRIVDHLMAWGDATDVPVKVSADDLF